MLNNVIRFLKTPVAAICNLVSQEVYWALQTSRHHQTQHWASFVVYPKRKRGVIPMSTWSYRLTRVPHTCRRVCSSMVLNVRHLYSEIVKGCHTPLAVGQRKLKWLCSAVLPHISIPKWDGLGRWSWGLWSGVQQVDKCDKHCPRSPGMAFITQTARNKRVFNKLVWISTPNLDTCICMRPQRVRLFIREI